MVPWKLREDRGSQRKWSRASSTAKKTIKIGSDPTEMEVKYIGMWWKYSYWSREKRRLIIGCWRKTRTVKKWRKPMWTSTLERIVSGMEVFKKLVLTGQTYANLHAETKATLLYKVVGKNSLGHHTGSLSQWDWRREKSLGKNTK